MRSFVVPFALLALAVFAACDDDGDATRTPDAGGTATSTATQSASPTATSTSVPTPTFAPPFTTPATPPVEAPSTVQLVDLKSGDVHLLYQHHQLSAYGVGFSGAGVRLYAGQEAFEFDLDGDPVSTEPIVVPTCSAIAGAERCSPVSPDGRWLPYQTRSGEYTYPNGDTVPTFDQWVLDLETGASRLLQEGLIPCGGCDGRWGPRWSPSSSYVVYEESGGDGRRWLSDVVSGFTVQIGHGFEITHAPAWSLVGDQVLYSTAEGGTMFHDPVAGTAYELPLAWPAAFDATGRFAYSPGWYHHVDEQKDPDAPEPRTTVLDLTSGQVVARLAGAPPGNYLWDTFPAVAATDRGLLVALQGADACEGTAIYVDGDLDRCIEGGVEARIASNDTVAVARVARELGHVEGAWGGSLGGREFAIDVIFPEGTVETVLEGAISLDRAPEMTWNSEGTHLLVQWPRFVGL
jgi:hypothetical protein